MSLCHACIVLTCFNIRLFIPSVLDNLQRESMLR